jgi:Bacterial Ig domain
MVEAMRMTRYVRHGRQMITLLAAAGAVGCVGEPADPAGPADDEAEVAVDEAAAVSGCTVSIMAAETAVTLGQPIHFSANATCPVATPEVQWFQKINSNWRAISDHDTVTTLTFDSTDSAVGSHLFYAAVREQGTIDAPATSSTLGVTINDNVPSCTSVRLTSPGRTATGSAGSPVALAAAALCPVGVVPEYQFWVKPVTTTTWVVLPGYTLGTSSWTPPSGGTWNVQAVARAQGAHVAYQVRSSSISMVIDQPSNLAPLAVNDAISTPANAAGSVDVLLNDSDPDGDSFAVTSFTQGANGVVGFAGSVATYTPAQDFVGSDVFTYTITDDHGLTATGTVDVTVRSNTPGCTISIASATASPVYGQNIHLDATASCNTGAAEIQWYHRENSVWRIVQPFSLSTSLDITASVAGNDSYHAVARTQGTTSPLATSSTLTLRVADNAASCSSVRMTQPVTGGTGTTGVALTLSALAVCPAGVTPEHQFWVKRSTSATWIVLPGYSLTTGSWTPPGPGTWNIKAAARAVGAHVSYQVLSPSISVTIN